MTLKSRHQAYARLLLLIFISILAARTFHLHEPQLPGPAAICVDCSTGVPHSGHLSTDAGGWSECLVCQFLSLVFIVPVAGMLSPMQRAACRKNGHRGAHIIVQSLNLRSPRAPPFHAVL
ncbi:MAG: hypothetical protein IJ244_03480 [Bacteroidaceae bacterium]|nr:hypothetical protein [Bacteroidaceae bacterium]